MDALDALDWQRLKPLLDGAPVVAFARDLEGRYLYVNRAFERLVGMSAAQVLGRPIEQVLPLEAAARVRESDRQTLEGRRCLVFDSYFKFPLLDTAGQPLAVFGFGTDVTDRRHREDALQAASLAVSSAKGEEIFQELTRYLATILNVQLALIGRLTDKSPRTIRTLGIYGGGAYGKNFEYLLDATPCRGVVNGGFSVVPNDVAALFPEDKYLPRGAVAYAGYPLKDAAGGVNGVIAIISQQPIGDARLFESVLKIFAVRAAAEIERGDHEEARRASEANYRAIFEASEDAIFIHDCDTGAILDVNPKACSAYGYTREELRGLTAGDISGNEPPYTDEEAARLIGEVRSGRGPLRFEWRRKNKDGSLHWDEVTLKKVDIAGKPHVMAMTREITERKSAVEALRTSEEQYRAIFNATADSLVLRDAGFRVVDVNPAYEAMSGRKRAEVLGRDGLTMSPPELNEHVRRLHARALAGEQVLFEALARRKDGSRFDIETRGVPILHQGLPHVLYIGRDISARRSAEAERAQLEAQLRQAQKMEAIGQLTGGIAHDFNNILQSVLGNLTLAGERVAELRDAKLARYLERAQLSAQRARDLIQQMLTFSRAKRGEPRLLSLGLLVAEAAKLLRPTLPSTIEVKLDLNDEAQVKVDRVQAEQVLLNLCINARDAMAGEGAITLAVRVAAQAGGVCTACRQKFYGAFVELSVRDSGPGIAPEVVDRMFEPFFSTKEVGKGSGMGLSTVHGIVHEHGGHVLVETVGGEGSVFRVLFPAASGEPLPEEKKRGPRAKPKLTGSVLVVDDENIILELMGDLLADWGLEVTLKSSGLDAKKAFAAEPQRYDLVLTDHTMPRITGLELARQIRGIRPGTPVILYTGYGEDIAEAQLAAAGVRALARKPVEPAELFTLLKVNLKQNRNAVK